MDDAEVPGLLPARMLNEFAYCPRLFFLEWVQSRFVDNDDTADGRFVHRYVDTPAGSPPAPDDVDAECPAARPDPDCVLLAVGADSISSAPAARCSSSACRHAAGAGGAVGIRL